MFCCQELSKLADQEFIRTGPVHKLPNGRILTGIDTEFWLSFGEGRPSYAGLNYCPFCGRALSRELWNREKKK